MTKILIGRPVVRETDVFERTDVIVVAMHPRYLEIRLKGHRETLRVDYEAILALGRRLAWRKAQKGA